ncbi:hypothetical protein K437DRAFT_76181 [Tilletiaria anomala UBC 951]|uniref:Uncharacterized protein n=1 Tax=Tilletiaria anomala (strain ATCC 24038 / CBS 436.72 / UBC 951) TaxID=1037660 RepID=A0A066W6G4_TILAU|nr:uncharacterized protein K437DRAFT_76181 [Tilletiaria anomala UBC 951]KDN49562.1 hypothetical protein K437DRAFT_76181 [Tilletiaria anomala UBC 951]
MELESKEEHWMCLLPRIEGDHVCSDPHTLRTFIWLIASGKHSRAPGHDILLPTQVHTVWRRLIMVRRWPKSTYALSALLFVSAVTGELHILSWSCTYSVSYDLGPW